jgi:hypothetical protein
MRKTPAPVLHWPKLFEGWMEVIPYDYSNGYGYKGNGYGDSYQGSGGTNMGGSGNGEGNGPYYGGRR